MVFTYYNIRSLPQDNATFKKQEIADTALHWGDMLHHRDRKRREGQAHSRFYLKTDEEKVDLILSGKAFLVNLELPFRGGVAAKDGYEDVIGHFCYVDFSRYKEDPSSSPMFTHLVNTPLCSQTTFTYDLKEIVTLATAYDDPTVHVMQPSAFVFHESRCGSTLVANALTAMDPTRHRVYSESRPPIMAIKACGITGEVCPPHRAAELLQDVVYMMGRTRDPTEEGLFFKIQSLGTKYMDVVIEAFPNTPWIFVYRDPVQIMMSQFAHGERKANCVRQLKDIPMKDQEFLISIDQDVYHLNPQEKCAFHLSTLCNTAIEAIGRSEGMGMGINYENIVDKLIEDVFPHHFNLPMSDERRERILDISGHYSKGVGNRANRDWKEDSKEKEERATIEIKEASDTFLYRSYNLLENSGKNT